IVESRYGGISTGGTAWRLYGKFAGRDAQRLQDGRPAENGRRRGQVGLRVDGGIPGVRSWFITADAFHSRVDLGPIARGEFSDLSLLGQWSQRLSGGSRVQVRAYYRREYRRIPDQLTHDIDIFDIDAQHALDVGTRHAIVWGVGARGNSD